MRLLTRRRFAAASVFGTVCPAHPSQSSSEQPAFRSTTSLVLLEVSVFDLHGVPVAGLEKSDFQVKESGRPRRISHFSTGAGQVSVGLVVDLSRSMRARQAAVASAAAQFSAQLQPADELFFVLFNESILVESLPKLLTALTPAEVTSIVASAPCDGQTALYDAVLNGADLARNSAHARRVLVVLSDGADTASKSSWSDTLAAIQASNLLIYTVGIRADGGEPGAPGVLRRLAETTGGFAVFNPDPASLPAFFQRVVSDLRARYVLGYQAVEPTAGRTETRALRVNILNPAIRNVRIRTRKQYRIQAAGV